MMFGDDGPVAGLDRLVGCIRLDLEDSIGAFGIVHEQGADLTEIRVGIAEAMGYGLEEVIFSRMQDTVGACNEHEALEYVSLDGRLVRQHAADTVSVNFEASHVLLGMIVDAANVLAVPRADLQKPLKGFGLGIDRNTVGRRKLPRERYESRCESRCLVSAFAGGEAEQGL